MDTDQAMTIEDEEQAEEPKKRGRGCLPWAIILGILVLGGLATAPLIGMTIFRTETPLPGEEFITDLGLRMLAVPAEFQDRKMPGGTDPAIREQRAARGAEMFAVECAFCHGNEARGDAPLGIGMYPPAADLHRDRTQTKSEGQLFWLIAHGINLTGMPAFGQNYPGGFHTDEEIWDLVAFVQSLNTP